MAYNYLELVNSVSRRLNETELTSSNFATAKGFYANIKDAVNASIRDINQYHLYWPYNHNSDEITLVAGETRYAIADEAKYVDFNTFRLKRDSDVGIGTAKKLRQVSYLEYVDRYIDQEDETDALKGGQPDYVFRTQDGYFGIVPMPDKAYTIQYEYFTYPVDLSLYDDVPTIPEPYKHVIVDGAMYYSYMFRDNMEMASISKNKFEEGMKNMRKILVNENVYVRSI